MASSTQQAYCHLFFFYLELHFKNIFNLKKNNKLNYLILSNYFNAFNMFLKQKKILLKKLSQHYQAHVIRNHDGVEVQELFCFLLFSLFFNLMGPN
jgi:hypothetical protein